MRRKTLMFYLCCGTLVMGALVRYRAVHPTESVPLVKDKALGLATHGGLTARPSLPKDSNSETALRLEETIRNKNQVCKSSKISDPEHLPNAYLSYKHKLLYVPGTKLGSTFWKRAMRVLTTNITSIYNIPPNSAHDWQRYPGLYRPDENKLRQYYRNYTSFHFVRDPFTRLFSAFVDKLYLPSPFSLKEGRRVHRFRNIDGLSRLSGYNISFSDFVPWLTDAYKTYQKVNTHFSLKMWKQFAPCKVHFTYIGKLENFYNDASYILGSVGVNISEVTQVENADSSAIYDKDEMKATTNRVLTFMQGRGIMAQRYILERLWMAFKIQGYLDKSLVMPTFQKRRLTATEFVNAVWKAYDSQNATKSARSAQRRESLMEAYSTVPRDVLKALAVHYKYDCLLFGYSCDVDEKFPSPGSIKPFYFAKRWHY